MHILPSYSLAYALLLAATAVAAVFSGKNLPDALSAHAAEPAPTRASAQDLAYGALRRFGQGDAILAALLSRPLPMPEARALLLCSFYRLETRPEAAHTVVDQAVEAAGSWPAALFVGSSMVSCAIFCASESFCSRGWMAMRRCINIPAGGWSACAERTPRLGNKSLMPKPAAADGVAGESAPNQPGRLSAKTGGSRYQCYTAWFGWPIAGTAATRGCRPASLKGLLRCRMVAPSALPSCLVPAKARAGRRAAPGGKAAHMLELADIQLTALEVRRGAVGVSTKTSTVSVLRLRSRWRIVARCPSGGMACRSTASLPTCPALHPVSSVVIRTAMVTPRN